MLMSPASILRWWNVCWAKKMLLGRCCSVYCYTAPIIQSRDESFRQSSQIKKPAPLREGHSKTERLMGPYNLGGGSLWKHLFNLFNGVDQVDGSSVRMRV